MLWSDSHSLGESASCPPCLASPAQAMNISYHAGYA